jgi:hypothetical protein
MALIDPSLLHLVGTGLLSDAYAADGHHLRWSFDQRLGFPRRAFCLDRRPSKLRDRLAGQLSKREVLPTDQGERPAYQGPQLGAGRPDGTVLLGGDGLVLTEDPLLVDLHGGSSADPAPASWVRLRLRADPGVVIRAEAVMGGWGEDAVVAGGTAAGPAGPDPSVQLVLAATRIDMVRVAGAGAGAALAAVEWVTTEGLDDDKAQWERVACLPMLTDEARYRHDNAQLFSGSTKAMAFKLLTGPGRPTGAEPLDDPQVPPSRPASDAELLGRYLQPYVDRLEPWARQVLADSAALGLHQSEITVSVPMDEMSTPGGGNVAGSIGPAKDLALPIYSLLLMASLSFQVGRQLGLAAVLPAPDAEAWDYRVRGVWTQDDLQLWPAARSRRAAALAVAVPDETSAQLGERLVALVAALDERAAAIAAVHAMVAAEGPVVEVHGFAFGIQLAKRPLFDPPALLDIAQLGAVAPPAPGGAQEGLAQLSWPLRPRSGTADDAAVPVGAILCRAAAGGPAPFTDVLNGRDLDSGLALATIPVQDPLAPGGAGTTSFWDRHVPANEKLTYAVSECDPFGRWSAFVRADSRWDHVVPPPAPRVTATLAPELLTARLVWPPVGPPLPGAQGMTLRVHLRRDLPIPPSDPTFSAVVLDPSNWPGCEGTPGTGAAPFAFPASTTGLTTSHDGMAVTVTPAPDGFTVTFQGIAMLPDAAGRCRVYVATSAVDAVPSSSVGGPALAELVLESPPDIPVLQVHPDPLLATFPDALDRSTRSFTVPGVAGARYTLLRASEYDVAAAAQRLGISTAAYSSATTPADRAVALKELAVSTRDAFAPGPVVDADGSPVVLTDVLPGGLKTLTVYTVAARAANGAAAPWPTAASAFAVVAVPQIPAPTTPFVVRGEWRPGVPGDPDAEVAVPHVELTIAAPGPGTGPVARYEVYRTADLASAEDVRRMTPLHALDVTTSSWSTETVTGVPIQVVRWRDAAVSDWTAYAYRVVARGAAAPAAVGPVGTRSAASQPVVVESLAVTAPEATGLTATLTPTPDPTASVTFGATIPGAAHGPSDGVLRQVVAGRKLQVARARLDPATSSFTLSGGILPPASGDAAALEVSIIDPIGREGAAVPVTTSPMP